MFDFFKEDTYLCVNEQHGNEYWANRDCVS